MNQAGWRAIRPWNNTAISWLLATTAAITTIPTAIATTVAPITAISTTTTAAAPATAAGRTIFPRTGDVDRQGAALKFFIMKHLYRLVGIFRSSHLNEGKTPGFTGELVHHYIDGINDSRLGKMILQIIVHGLVGKVAYEETRFIHNQYTFGRSKNRVGSCCPGSSSECRSNFRGYRQSVFLTPTPLFFALTGKTL
jgi:hypothetical protein